MAAQGPAPRPAWKEPMVWLVAAIPLASVLASAALLFAAARSTGSDDAVADRVQRTAQIQLADLGADLAAHRMGLAASLQVDGDRIRLVATTGAFPRDRALRLALRHPARAQDDLDLLLQPDAGGWSAQRRLPRGHDWNLELAPVDGRWRLQGRLAQGRREAVLRPAVAEQ